MVKVALFFASFKEANSLLYQSQFKWSHNKGIYLSEYQNIKIQLIVTGIGKDNCLKKVTEFGNNDFDCVIKAGTCALLSNKFDILTPCIPSRIVYGKNKIDINLNKVNQRYYRDSKLLTVNQPLVLENSNSLTEFDFADMESFHILEYFNCSNKFAIITGTDYGNENAFYDFKKNLPKASFVLKDALTRGLCLLYNELKK